MDIKPTRQNLNNPLDPNSRLKSVAVANNAKSDRATPSDDKVTVTDTATRIRQLEANLSTMPDIDNARVQAIRQAISEGSYRIDPDRIAANLLKLEKDLV